MVDINSLTTKITETLEIGQGLSFSYEPKKILIQTTISERYCEKIWIRTTISERYCEVPAILCKALET